MDATRVVWVTGAGSGMGRAAAVRRGRRGRSRRADRPSPRASGRNRSAGGRSGWPEQAVSVDARDPVAVASAHDDIVAAWDGVTDLVLAAGLNTRTRYWRDQSLGEFESIVATNLTAVVRVIDTVLPGMRARGSGQVVVVSSYAAWRFSPHAGVAYTASKTALAAVCASLNAQEAAHGIRACHLCPGDVDTEFLALRPNAPDAEARLVMLSSDDVAAAVLFVLQAPAHVRIDELVISPVSQV